MFVRPLRPLRSRDRQRALPYISRVRQRDWRQGLVVYLGCRLSGSSLQVEFLAYLVHGYAIGVVRRGFLEALNGL